MENNLEKEYRGVIGIPDDHRLVLTDSKTVQKHGRDDDDFYFDELDQNGNVVAKYHAWSRISIYPPHNPDSGFKKVA